MTYDMTYLSLGAGVQSSAMLVASNLGLHGVPRADVAIFADTGYEPQYVYDYLEVLQKWSEIPVEVVTKSKSHDSTRSLIPAYTRHPSGESGILLRKCTSEWKVQPIRKRVRELLGYAPRQVIKKRALALIGISLDEAQRMKPSKDKWIDNCYPLIDARLRRNECIRIVTDAGLPMPQRSACYFCPFHSTHEWKFLRDQHPAEWAKAVEFDKSIRNSTRAGLKLPVFLHSSCRPLDEVLLDRPEKELFAEPDHFQNECEGMCGV